MIKATEEKYSHEQKLMGTVGHLESKITFLEQKCSSLMQQQQFVQQSQVVYQPAQTSYEYKTETNYAPIELKTEVVAENMVTPSYEFKEFKVEDYAIPSSTLENVESIQVHNM